MEPEFEIRREFAMRMDDEDPLKEFRNEFNIPLINNQDAIYLNGNSLGLQPKITTEFVLKELDDWKNDAEDGHFTGETPWVSYHETLGNSMAKLVGAKNHEVVVMNTLTVNLHLMMVSFYRPNPTKFKILIEYNAFPSDQYAVVSQIKFHGFDPKEALIELKPSNGEIVSEKDIEEVFKNEGDKIALIMLGGINYYTGQVYDMEGIAKLARKYDCVVGYDLAHGVGNVPLSLHDWNVDFAVWCSYKYLNSGPGSVGGAFIHDKHAENSSLPRFTGWWGHDKERRFLMENKFVPIYGAEGWQLSNPPILSLAAIRASMVLFDRAGIDNLRKKSVKLTNYLRYLLNQKLKNHLTILTPSEIKSQGCQLSIVIGKGGKDVLNELRKNGIFADWREPDVIRIAPVPLYNTFSDCFMFVEILTKVLNSMN